MRILHGFLAVLLALPLAALADRPGYNFVDAGYLRHRLDSGCVQDGLELGGSLEVSDRTFLQGRFSDVGSNRDGKNSCASSLLQLGAGINGDFSEQASFYGSLSGVRFDPNIGRSKLGWAAEAGLRTYLAPGIEVHAALGLVEASPLSETYIKVGGVYWFEVFAVYFDVSNSNDDTASFAMGARFTF